MKIGILIPQFPGQTHAFFWREVSNLERLGVEVHLFSTRRPPSSLVSHSWSSNASFRTTYLKFGSFTDRAEAIIRLPFIIKHLRSRNEGVSALKSAIISISAAIALRKKCKDRRIEHIHVHSAANCAMIAAISKYIGGPTYSVTLHGPIKDYGPAQKFKWSGASFGFAITKKIRDELANELNESSPSPIHIVPMGVDPYKFQPESEYIGRSENEPVRLFTCARLNPVKGHETVINALEILKNSGLIAHLTIAGEDDEGGTGYRRFLERKISESEVADQVNLLGAVGENTIVRYLQSSHIFVLASRHEPLGVAYMEAMACGCPTIGTDAGGVAELIENGRDGILVTPDDAVSLADAIMRVAGDKSLARTLSISGRQKIVAEFGAHRSAEAMISAISEIK